MNICVYGAASNTIDNSYIQAGEQLGEIMGKTGHSLIFGGGANGLMGAVARGVSKSGGKVTSVVPYFFNGDGILFDKASELIRCDTMRERKQIMEDNSDAFIMTPGGLGTFDEFFEMYTLKSLGRHTKPIAILNTNGYFNALIKMLKNTADNGFMLHSTLDIIGVFDNPKDVMDYIEISVKKWI